MRDDLIVAGTAGERNAGRGFRSGARSRIPLTRGRAAAPCIVTFQRELLHAEVAKDRIRLFVDQVETPFAAEGAKRSIVERFRTCHPESLFDRSHPSGQGDQFPPNRDLLQQFVQFAEHAHG